MISDEQRKAFEQWATSQQFCLERFDAVGEYMNDNTHFAWRAWQAAQAAQAEEIERLKQRIADMELAFASQAKTAIAAIDNAKATASHMLKLAEEKEKALNPALLESEREANAILTNRAQDLEQALRTLLDNSDFPSVRMLIDARKALEGKP